MPDIVRVRLPVGLHLGEKVSLKDSLNLRDRALAIESHISRCCHSGEASGAGSGSANRREGAWTGEEVSPPAVRGPFPGFAYQLGNLLSSWNGVKQARVAEQHYGGVFAPVLAWTVLLVASLVAIVTWSGKERRGADLSNTK